MIAAETDDLYALFDNLADFDVDLAVGRQHIHRHHVHIAVIITFTF